MNLLNEETGLEFVHAELLSSDVRWQIFVRLETYINNGYRDPELLYLAARYAASLGIKNQTIDYLDELSAFFPETDGYIPDGFFPIGLLYLYVLPPGDNQREKILTKLKKIAQSSPVLLSIIKKSGYADLEQNDNHSLYKNLHSIEKNENGIGDYLLNYLVKEDKIISELQEFSKNALNAYSQNDLEEARLNLERMLLLDGDQIEVLRNLLTITSEQKDSEGYERYWRRYIKSLLWKMMWPETRLLATEEIIKFYSKVMSATSRDIEKKHEELTDILRTKGFLSHWLEAVSGLSWLFMIASPAGENAGYFSENELSEFISFWYRLFYPEFYPFVNQKKLKENIPGEGRFIYQNRIIEDPVFKLIKYGYIWGEIGYGIKLENDKDPQSINPHFSNVMALCAFLFKLPFDRYLPQFVSLVNSRQNQEGNYRRMFLDKAGFPFRLVLGSFFKNENWEGFINMMEGYAATANLPPDLAMFLSFALCRVHRESEGFDLMISSLPTFLKNDVVSTDEGQETQIVNLCRGVIRANVDLYTKRMEEKPIPYSPIQEGLTGLLKRIENIQVSKDVTSLLQTLRDDIAGVSEAIHNRRLLDETIADVQKLVPNGKFSSARKRIMALPDSEGIREVKKDLLTQIDQAEENAKMQEKVEQMISSVKRNVKYGKFFAARAEVNSLSGNMPGLSELKRNLLSQIDQAESQNNLQNTIEETVEKVKRHLQYADFESAKSAVLNIPGNSDDIMEVKKNLLLQIFEVENRYHGR